MFRRPLDHESRAYRTSQQVRSERGVAELAPQSPRDTGSARELSRARVTHDGSNKRGDDAHCRAGLCLDLADVVE